MKDVAVLVCLPPKPVVHRDNREAFRDLLSRGQKVRELFLNAANKLGIVPQYLFDDDETLIETRDALWSEFGRLAVAYADIARWWHVHPKVVHYAINQYRVEEQLIERRHHNETAPRMVTGRGEKHEDCTRYDSCLNVFARKSSTHGRCPFECSGYTQIRRHATDYLKQLDAPTVCAQARPKGAGI